MADPQHDHLGAVIVIYLLAFCTTALFFGKFHWHFDLEKLRTLCVTALK
jgi:hypothetical protein